MPAKAKSGRGSSPFKANQCHVAGDRAFGSEKLVTGTRQRRSLNDPLQKDDKRTCRRERW